MESNLPLHKVICDGGHGDHEDDGGHVDDGGQEDGGVQEDGDVQEDGGVHEDGDVQEDGGVHVDQGAQVGRDEHVLPLGNLVVHGGVVHEEGLKKKKDVSYLNCLLKRHSKNNKNKKIKTSLA
ncbi:Hypothetical predicted protein [Pelobates cultripes]|uniref:Uncharacterized protein n=1 Tax=Pelobates cultripes TaxID=61616 RepID=A0AAD1WHL5_PELCU|nr:Hypothetical predicted protein [Pelobates cultripes]